MYLRCFGFAFAVVTFGIVATQGAVKTWTGLGGTGNWGTAGNWAPAGVPANNDDLVFPAGAPFLNNTNTIVGRTINSISFNGASGGYNLRGNTITLVAGITASHSAGANDVEIAITFGGIQTFGTATAAGSLSVSGNIDINGTRLVVNANTATVTLSGIISGTGTLSKSGAGLLILSGANANTYNGTMTVPIGTLQLSKVVGPAVTGDLTVFSTATLTAGNQIADSADVTLNSATLNLNNNNDAIGALTIISSTIDTGSGTLTLGGDVTANGPSTINGNLHLGSVTRTVNVSGAPTLNIFANIAGGLSGIFPNLVFAGITKTGTGALALWGTNTFGGTVTMNGGDIIANSDTAFGSIGGGVVVNAGLLRPQLVHIGTEPLTINVREGLFSILSLGASSWSGPITLNSNAMFDSAGTLTLSNAISGPGGLSLHGDIFEFAGTNDNTYAGLTVSIADLLRLNKTGADAIPGDLEIGESGSPDDADVVRNLQNFQIIGDVTVNCSGLLDLNNTSDTIGSLTLEGGSVATGTGTLTVTGLINVDTGGSGCTLSRIAGRLNVSSGTRNISFPVGSLALFAPDLEVDATVVGSANIVVGGNSGDLFLNVSNGFTGTFSVSSSANPGLTVHLGHDFALGATTAGTTVDNRAGLFVEVAPNTIREPLTACGVGPNGNGVIQVNGTVTWDTNVVFGCEAVVNVLAASSLTIDGAISGAGGFRKVGPGTMTLAGTTQNTYGGDTTVDTGVLNLAKTGAIAIRNGILTIGDDEGGANVDQVRYTVAGNQINVTVPITIYGSGILDLNGTSDEIGALTLLGGDVTTGTGTAGLGGNVTSLPSTNTLSIISGRVNLSGTRLFNITNGTFSPDVRIDAQVVGSGALTKNGIGELSLNSSNSYSGLTTVNAGVLDVDDSFALGGTNNGTVVNRDGSLVVRFNSHVGLEPLTLNGDGAAASIGALDGRFGSNSWAGAILINTNSTITVNSASDFLNLSGAISGADIFKEGLGTLLFSGNTANTFDDMVVNAGTLLLAKTIPNVAIPNELYIGDGSGGGNADVVRIISIAQINNLAGVHIATSGLLDLNDLLESIGAIDGFGRVDLGSGTLNPGGNNDSGTYSGLIVGTGGGLTKTGTGTLILTGNNTYSGPTAVNGGTLAVNGSQPLSPVSINSFGTLAGSGTVGNLSVNGNLSPNSNPILLSSAPAILTSSNVAFMAAADFFVDLNGPNPGTDYDQLNVRGTNNLGASALHVAAGPGLAPEEGDRF